MIEDTEWKECSEVSSITFHSAALNQRKVGAFSYAFCSAESCMSKAEPTFPNKEWNCTNSSNKATWQSTKQCFCT